MKRFRRTVAIDFDGVIHKHVSKWTEAWEIHDGPVEGAFEFLERVLLEFDVAIFSARAVDPDGRAAISEWLVRNWMTSGRDPKWVALIRISAEKPHAFIYIDDRGWRFEGTFPTMDEIRSFESWTKKLKPAEPVEERWVVMKDLSNTPEKDVFGARLDELNELLDQAATLMGRRFVAPAEIDYMIGSVRRRLGFRKSGDAYVIVDGGPPGYDWAPIREKSSEIRVEAAKQLNALWLVCLGRDVEVRARLETSIEYVEVFLREHGNQK